MRDDKSLEAWVSDKLKGLSNYSVWTHVLWILKQVNILLSEHHFLQVDICSVISEVYWQLEVSS